MQSLDKIKIIPIKIIIIIGTNKSNKIFSFAVNPSIKHNETSLFSEFNTNDKSNIDTKDLNVTVIDLIIIIEQLLVDNINNI